MVVAVVIIIRVAVVVPVTTNAVNQTTNQIVNLKYRREYQTLVKKNTSTDGTNTMQCHSQHTKSSAAVGGAVAAVASVAEREVSLLLVLSSLSPACLLMELLVLRVVV